VNTAPRRSTFDALKFRALSAEGPYQVVMITAILELLLLATLAPRSSGFAPLCYEAVAGLRLAAGIVLGVMLATARSPRREDDPDDFTTPPVSRLEGLVTLGVWSAILFPPELWAFALEARAGLPWTALTSLAVSVGCFAALRWHPRIGWVFPALVVTAYLLQGIRLEPPSVSVLILSALGLSLLALRERHPKGVL
jgi:hypothetical protein